MLFLDVDIVIALISLLGVILSAIVTSYYRKQASADGEREKLVTTLKGLVEAQASKIKQLEETIAIGTEEIRKLQMQVEELREVIVTQAILIENLSQNR
jgi:SMC interacting uncharacterized protein involved in chromosome segregation